MIKKIIKYGKCLFLFVSFSFLILYFLIYIGIFDLKEIKIIGNNYYKEEQIKNIISKDGKNILNAFLKYNILNEENIPFIEDVKITINGPDNITVKITEKNILGYVKYMGTNLYFDNDGVVLDSTNAILKNVACIEGMNFDTLELGKPLEVKNEELFNALRLINQSMKKYELNPTDIYLINKGREIVISFGKVRVNMGTGDNIDIKAARIKSLMPELEDRSGVLHMEEYTNDTKTISFINDDIEK